MDTDRLARLFDRAVGLPPAERSRFLRSSCAGDANLLRAVETLLASHEDSDFLESPLVRPRAEAVAELDPFVDAPPRRIGPYEILARIGDGGMSSVFLARRGDGEKPAGEVAVKLLRVDLVGVDKRFARERKILESLAHPLLVELYESGVTVDRRPYFVMEYIDGLPITHHCDVRRLSVERRLRLFLEVCDAVHHAHQHLVVHRDLKPSNILVDGDGHPRLLDFGIAKWLEEAGRDGRTTSSPALLLTPSYAAPEHIAGERITTVTDVYSLGVLLFELLTGSLPRDWSGRSQAEILRRWRWEEPPPPSRTLAACEQHHATEIARQRSTRPASLIRRLQGDLDNIALRAVRFEPHRRYESVRELAADVRRHLDGQPVHARPATRRYRLAKLLRRHAVLAANLCLLVVVLGAVAVQSALQARRVARERDVAEQERQRADEAIQFLIDSFQLSDPRSGPGDDTSAGQILERAARWARADLEGRPATQAKVLHTLGEIHAGLGLYEQAAEILERAGEIRRRLHGPTHAETLESLATLASVRMQLGQLDVAEEMARHLLTASEGSPLSGASRRQLADILAEKGDYDEAERLAREALATHRAAGPGMLREVAQDLNTLMETQYKSGDVRGAAETGRAALETSRRAFAAGSIAIASDIGNLGAAEWSLGRFEEAERLFTEALEIHRARLGPDHPTVATDLNNLGFLRLEIRDARSAEPLFREALELLRSRFGDEHPRMAQARVSLGTALMLGLRFEQAEEQFREALRVHRRRPGPGSPAEAEDLHNLGTLYFLDDEPRSAEPPLRQALEIRRRLFGERGLRTGETLMMLARVDHRLGRLDSAESLYREAKECFTGSAGEAHWLVALVGLRLAELSVDRRDPVRGEELARGAMAALSDALAPDHWRVGEARSVLGATLVAQGRTEEGENELLAAYETLCAAWGEPSLPTREARRRLEAHLDSRTGSAIGTGALSASGTECRRDADSSSATSAAG